MTRLLEWFWLRIRRITADEAATALIMQSDEKHREARAEPDAKRSSDLRAEADHLADSAKEIRDAIHFGPHEKP